jgi:hypothetical protein
VPLAHIEIPNQILENTFALSESVFHLTFVPLVLSVKYLNVLT